MQIAKHENMTIINYRDYLSQRRIVKRLQSNKPEKNHLRRNKPEN